MSGAAGNGMVRCRAVAPDIGSTSSTDREDHVLGQKGVDSPAAAWHELAGLRVRLLLAPDATAAETLRPALQMAGVHELSAWGSSPAR